MKSVVALRTHKMNSAIAQLYEQLKDDLGRDRVFMVYDATHEPLESTLKDNHIMIFDDKECKKMNSMHKKSFLHPETSAVMFHDFLLDKSVDFDSFWFIEYDVRCHGSFAIPLAVCDDIQADFMAKGGDDRNEFRKGGIDYWTWWEHLEGDISSVPLEKRLGSFFPMVRFSKRFIEVLRSQFGKSTGFCELYCPTLCATHSDLILAPMPASVFGVFVHRPPIYLESIPCNNLLYHPIK